MKFPNAHNGVKKIFTAEILGLIGTIAMAVAGAAAIILAALVNAGNGSETSAAAGAVTAILAVFGIAGDILMLIGFILNLVGIKAAMKDEAAFKTAMVFTLIGIVASVFATIYSSNETVSGLMKILMDFTQLCVAVFVIRGIMNLAEKLHNQKMVAGGRKATTYMTVAYCLPIVISFVSTLISLKAESTATMVLSLIALLLSIIAYIIFLNYLRRAVKMLEA